MWFLDALGLHFGVGLSGGLGGYLFSVVSTFCVGLI